MRRISFGSVILALLVCLVCSAPAWAQTPPPLPCPDATNPLCWQVGYVFVAIGGGQYEVFKNDGTFVQFISLGGSGTTAGCGFNGTFDLYTTDFDNSNVVIFDGNDPGHAPGAPLPVGVNYLTPPLTTNVHPESVTVDSSGNIYVGFADLQTIVNGKVKIVAGGGLEKFDPSATTRLAAYTPGTENRGTDWIDLGTDQHTIFYTSEGHKILTFDTLSRTSGTFASNIFTNSTDQLFALKLLPTDPNTFDGSAGVLVADTTDIKLVKVSNGVTTVTKYTAPKISDWVALALDPDGAHFWAGDAKTGQIFRFALDGTGKPLAVQTAAANGALNGICVKGAHQQNIVPLQYPKGSNVQNFAAFGGLAPTSTTPNLNYHTWTSTVGSVTIPFTLVVSATEGIDPTRFDEYFTGQYPSTLKPIPYADQTIQNPDNSFGQPVVYRVENPPPTADYSLGITFSIAFNRPSSYTPPTCLPAATYPFGNPRFLRDPSAPDPDNGFPVDAAMNHQFAIDSTLFDNNFGKFGDPVYSGGKTYNDYVVADRCPSVTNVVGGATGATATFNSPTPGSTNTSRSIPVKVTVTDANGNTVTNGVTAPNNIIGSVVNQKGELQGFSSHSGFSAFTFNGQSYAAVFSTKGLSADTTSLTICVSSIDDNAAVNFGQTGGPGQFGSACVGPIFVK